MSGTARPPCAELVRVAEVIEQMIAQYVRGLRGVPAIGRWEAPQEGIALGWLLVRNVDAVIELARRDEVLVIAAWSNARVAFELATRIIWMLRPGDRYEAECRWLALLGEYVETERKLAREVPEHTDFHNDKADAIQMFREGVISALPSGYHVRRIPNFLDMLKELETPEMYRFYREGSQYIHGSMYLDFRSFRGRRALIQQAQAVPRGGDPVRHARTHLPGHCGRRIDQDLAARSGP